MDSDPRYADHVQRLFALLKEAERGGRLLIDQERLRRSQWHTQLWVSREDRGERVDLKIDLVNDTAPRVGAVESDPVLGRSDTWQNILANKVAAVFRYEPKDVADIWIIARNRGFAWGEVISDALRKEGGTDPVALHGILRTVPREELARVAWASPVDLSGVSADLKLIADDILYRRANSLFPR
ncbi:MAG: hypothetical protein A2V99_08175 [Spirochaetes bacterium RBG_16_67_19]|nr:MAG: hypothetical protein A2V99_08175 [Spirochaetes bacterium RBG_16_67_19]